METPKKGKKNIGKVLLVLCNAALLIIAVLFTFWYSGNARTRQEALMRESFCNTVETMKQISVRYLTNEQNEAASWASYIEAQHMTMDEAIDYIRAVSDATACEAHFVDMDTFEAWSSNYANGSNTVNAYKRYHELGNIAADYISRLRKIYAGESCLLGKYRLRESERNVISLGHRITLRQADGSDRDYLLLRVVPVERMKELWLFPTSYDSAEIGLIDDQGNYVIPSLSMRSENFMEFVRSYNFPDDFYGADRTLAQLKEQDSGLLELKDAKGQDCYWYYSQLGTFEGIDILGYIPVSALSDEATNLSLVLIVTGILLLMMVMDGAYILSMNHRLRVTAKFAEKASNAKTQFLSSMSHDIRTPLNAVLGMTELAQSHMNDSEYVQECLRKISISGNHLLTLINDILEISRVESGRINLNPAPFEVHELVSGLESITRSQAVGHGLTLNVEYLELPEPRLVGDKLRLSQIYLNLLNNAVKYTNPGGSIRVEVGEEPLSDGRVTLMLVVADTGVGMSPEFQQIMYESFVRVSDSRIDKIQGTGLGLAIVKRMIDLMHGTIDCVSAQGVGTTFTVCIPLDVAPASLPAQPEAHNESAPGSDLTNVHVLIAEDNDINWEIISEMLSEYGIRCDRAENGRICVDKLTEAAPGSYDLVFMDVQMPVLNGRDAARALRQSARSDLRTIPIIAMTADAFAEDVQMCIDAGMDAHVAKPIEIEKVLAAIRLLLSRKSGADSRPC